MRTVWLLKSLPSAPRLANQWMSDKRKQLSLETGVKWQFFTMADKVIFRAAITKETPEAGPDLKKDDLILAALRDRGLMDFAHLADVTNLPLPEVLSRVKRLTKAQQLVADVDRTGNWVFAKPAAKSTAPKPAGPE